MFKLIRCPTTISWSWQKTQNPSIRDKKKKKKTWWVSCLYEFLLHPSSRAVGVEWARELLGTSGFASQLRSLELEPKSFVMDCKQTCLTFVAKRDIISMSLSSKRICPLLQRETISLSSTAVCFTTSLKRYSRTKATVPLLTTCSEMRETHGELSLNTHTCSKSQMLIYNRSSSYLYNSV